VKKVFWDYNIGNDCTNERDTKFPDDFHATPKKFRGGYGTGYDHTKCPAWKKWGDNTWLVTQPFDLKFKVITNAVYEENKFIESNLLPPVHEDYFILGNQWLAGEYPEIQMRYVMNVWTKDKDVWIEQVPHPLLSRYGLELIPATFPISVWFRPMVVGVKVLDSDIFLPKGTPLYYFRLYSKRSDSDFKLEQRDVPEKMVKQLNENNTLRKFTMFSAWDIIKGRVSKEGKCPFRWN